MAHGGGSLSRRQFLGAAAAGALLRRPAVADEAPPVSFFFVSDTHYLADREAPDRLDARSAAVTSRLIEQLNRLPGTPIPAEAGGGTVAPPAGVIHGGDLIDSGDKNGGPFPAMQRTEWASFTRDFGLTGRDGRLRYPVYEVHGNHDGPRGEGLVIEGITERNRTRPGLANRSANGLHYSWDWGPVHCANLGIVVGGSRETQRPRRYNPLGSFDFLAADLEAKVGTSGRPVILTHHVDVARYTGPCDPNAPPGSQEWDPCDVRAFHQALRGYNVIAILYGHTHVRNILYWDGASTRGAGGLSLFNVDNSSHFGDGAQAFFYFQVARDRLTVREYRTKDDWATAEWSPQVWTRPIPPSKNAAG